MRVAPIDERKFWDAAGVETEIGTGINTGWVPAQNLAGWPGVYAGGALNNVMSEDAAAAAGVDLHNYQDVRLSRDIEITKVLVQGFIDVPTLERAGAEVVWWMRPEVAPIIRIALVYDENGSDPGQEADWGEKVYTSRFGSALQDQGERILALRNKRYLSRFSVLAEETFDLRLYGEWVGGDEVLGESAPIRSRNGFKIPFKWVREGRWRTHFSESNNPVDRQILDGSMNIIVWASDTIHEILHLQWQSRVTFFNK